MKLFHQAFCIIAMLAFLFVPSAFLQAKGMMIVAASTAIMYPIAEWLELENHFSWLLTILGLLFLIVIFQQDTAKLETGVFTTLVVLAAIHEWKDLIVKFFKWFSC